MCRKAKARPSASASASASASTCGEGTVGGPHGEFFLCSLPPQPTPLPATPGPTDHRDSGRGSREDRVLPRATEHGDCLSMQAPCSAVFCGWFYTPSSRNFFLVQGEEGGISRSLHRGRGRGRRRGDEGMRGKYDTVMSTSGVNSNVLHFFVTRRENGCRVMRDNILFRAASTPASATTDCAR